MPLIEHLILFLPLTIAVFWFVIITISAIKERKRKLALSYFMLSGMVSIFSGVVFYEGYYDTFRDIYIVSVLLTLSQFPAFYLYIITLTSQYRLKGIIYIKHFSFPVLATFVAIYFNIFYFSSTERTFFFDEVLPGFSPIVGKFALAYYTDKLFKFAFIAFAIYYYDKTNKRIKEHASQTINYFSNTNTASIRWFSIFRVAFFLTLISGIVYHGFDRSFHIHNLWITLLVYSFLSLFYWVVGYFGYHQDDFYKASDLIGYREDECKADTSKSKVVNVDDVDEIIFLIDKVLGKNRMYLRSDLVLPDLARAIGAEQCHLSKAIETKFNLDFSTFINKKRVEYAKDILKSERIILCKDLAYTCGFDSIPSFHRAFKQFTGETPSRYRTMSLLSKKTVQ